MNDETNPSARIKPRRATTLPTGPSESLPITVPTEANGETLESFLEPAYQFRPAVSQARWVSGLTMATIIVCVVSIVFDYAQAHLLNSGSVTAREAAANDFRQQAIAIFFLLAYLSNFVAFLFWLHRVRVNVAAMGSKELRHSVAWTMGAFLLPIPIFILSPRWPYQALEDIWKASDPHIDRSDPVAWRSAPSTSLLWCWWVWWLMSVVLRYVSSSALHRATVDDLTYGTYLSMTWSVTTIVSLVLVKVLVDTITARQSACRADAATG